MENKFKDIASVVKQLKSGDQSAFPKLYELTYQRIHFLCYSILKNEEDAKDAVQETYIKIFSKLSTLQNDQFFVAWSNKIAYCICIRMLSGNKDILADDEFLTAITDDHVNHSPYGFAEKSEKAKVLADLINGLDPILRSTLVLKYFDDLKIKQIADIMECPEGTVKSRLNTAKSLLKSAIANERKGEILISTFAFFPLREAIALSAAQYSMALGSAGLAFNGVIAECGITSSLSFVPQPAARPMTHAPAPAIAASTGLAVGGAGLALSSIMLLTPPAISKIEAYQPTKGYTNQNIPVTAVIDSPHNMIKDVYLISDDGRRIDGTINKENIASFSISENGEYTIYVVKTNNLEAQATLSVTAIDKVPPTLIHYGYTQTELILELLDAESGIDFSSIFGETAEGKRTHPIAIDQKTNKITFDFPESDFRLTIKDMAGNFSLHYVERVEQ